MITIDVQSMRYINTANKKLRFMILRFNEKREIVSKEIQYNKNYKYYIITIIYTYIDCTIISIHLLRFYYTFMKYHNYLLVSLSYTHILIHKVYNISLIYII